MPDFVQSGSITTLHELGDVNLESFERMLREATQSYKLGLILPVTAGDMRAAPFPQIIDHLRDADYIDTIVVALGVAPDQADYREARDIVRPLGDRAEVLWTDGPQVSGLYQQLIDAGFSVSVPVPAGRSPVERVRVARLRYRRLRPYTVGPALFADGPSQPGL